MIAFGRILAPGMKSIGNYLRLLRTAEERGTTMVEAAIGVPVLLMFSILTFELARLAYYGCATQFVLSRVVRDAQIGPAVYAPQGENITQGQYISDQLRARARVFGVTLRPENISICLEIETSTSKTSCGQTTSGRPGTFFSVEVRTPVRLLFLGTYVTLARNFLPYPL